VLCTSSPPDPERAPNPKSDRDRDGAGGWSNSWGTLSAPTYPPCLEPRLQRTSYQPLGYRVFIHRVLGTHSYGMQYAKNAVFEQCRHIHSFCWVFLEVLDLFMTVLCFSCNFVWGIWAAILTGWGTCAPECLSLVLQCLRSYSHHA